MNKSSPIAIIGISGRFPGAKDINTFFDNIVNGVDAIILCESAKTINTDNYIPKKGVLHDACLFPADFFKFTPKTAEITDPQFRLFLECVWEAWENAGYPPMQYEGKVGVFATSSSHDSYYEKNLIKSKHYASEENSYEILIQNAKDFLATLVAYKFNFNGPCLNIQTACSSSLVAVSQACDALTSKQCDIAVAGGMSLTFPLQQGYFYKEGMIYSPDGKCRAFSQEASGVVPGNGGGVILLKLLKNAIRDGDNIHAIIRGHAVNNDGANKVSFTAPSVDGQLAVLKAAALNAKISPDTVQYIEAHGTGTQLGDQIELAALKEYLRSSERTSPCHVGSVKPNIGHLDVAAGIVGFIKTVLSLKNRLIPQSLYSDAIDREHDLESTLKIAQKTIPWEENTDNAPRRAGVSSFGVGGTNAHIILEEAPKRKVKLIRKEKPPYLLLFSAKTEEELLLMKDKYASFFHDNPDIDISNVSYTLQLGKESFKYRFSILCDDVQSAKDALYSPSELSYIKGQSSFNSSDIFYIFSGNMYPQPSYNVNKKIHITPFFNKEFLECVSVIEELLCDVSILYKEKLVAYLTDAALQYAAARSYIYLGIAPKKLIGYGNGEYLAACIAGLFKFCDFVSIIKKIFELKNEIGHSKCLIVRATLEELFHISEGLSIQLAATETFNRHIYTGDLVSLELFHNILNQQGIFSQIIDNVEDLPLILTREQITKWSSLIESLKFQDIDKNLIFDSEICDKSYWIEKIQQPLCFPDLLDNAVQRNAIFIEMNILNKCSSLIRQNINNNLILSEKIKVINNTSEYKHFNRLVFIQILAKLWADGVNINWSALYNAKRVKQSLPSYPFIKKYYCVEPNIEDSVSQPSISKDNKHGMPWIYTSEWVLKDLSTTNYLKYDALIMIEDYAGVLDFTKKIFNDIYNIPVISIKSIHSSLINKNESWLLNRVNEWESIFLTMSKNSKILILHAGIVSDHQIDPEKSQDEFYDFVAITRALNKINVPINLRIVTITDEYHSISRILFGPVMTLPLECTNISTHYIEISFKDNIENLARQIVNESIYFTADRFVKLGVKQRRIINYVKSEACKIKNKPINIKHGGTYLITGGLGGIGLVLADFLARHYQANLILISRSSIPDNSKWTQIIKEGSDQKLIEKLNFLSKISQVAASIKIIAGDIADTNFLRKSLGETTIDGIIHAASTVPSGLLVNKSIIAIENQFRAKIAGFKSLINIFGTDHLDFIILCSALNVVNGDVGMADYISANAYLDACAINKVNNKTSIISIAWDAWKEVGMLRDYKNSRERKFFLSINDNTVEKKELMIFIEEHKLNGDYIIPGSLLIELLIGVILNSKSKNSICAINNLYFLRKALIFNINLINLRITPCQDDERCYQIELKVESEWISICRSHLSLEVTHKEKKIEIKEKLIELMNQTPLERIDYHFPNTIKLGPHWDCLTWVKNCENKYLAKVILPDQYAYELDKFYLHPSIFDVAFSFHARFLSEQYLPFYIETINYYEPLPQQFYSLVSVDILDENLGICTACIDLIDLQGNLLIEIRNFTLKKAKEDLKNENLNNKIILNQETYGLSNAEAISVFQEILNNPLPYNIVSKSEIVKYENTFVESKNVDRASEGIIYDLKNMSLYHIVKNIWAEVLGINEIRNEDDFYAIGGDSLIAIQICYKLMKIMDVNIGPDILLQKSIFSDFYDAVDGVLKNG